MQKKPSILNIIVIVIGLIVLVYGLTQRSELTVLADEINEAVVEAQVDKLESKNDGKLVIVSGDIFASDTLTDEYFKVSHKTIKLKRVVEMYQWTQDCSTECVYLKVWSEPVINSSKFDDAHKNPDTKQYSSEEYFQKKTYLGEYRLSDKLVNDLRYDTIMGPDEMLENYGNSSNYSIVGEYITNSADIDNANIGDFRIHYEYVKDKSVTVIAKQSGDSFEPFYTEKKREIYDITEGQQSAADYIASMKKNNSLFGIILVIVGLLFIVFGAGAIIFDALKERKQQK